MLALIAQFEKLICESNAASLLYLPLFQEIGKPNISEAVGIPSRYRRGSQNAHPKTRWASGSGRGAWNATTYALG